MCEKKGSLCLSFVLGDNEPATDGCSGGGLGPGRTVRISVTAKMQGEGEEFNMFV